jgi:hypothetical protein
MINPNDSTNAASQLDAITSDNSPYIQQAKQAGMLSAASRGLQNSSLSAGASEAAAVQAAAPLAQQNAQAALAGAEQNAQLATQTSDLNAQQQNANQQLQAQLEEQQTQYNASQAQAAAATNAAAMNAINSQTEQIQGQLNTQFLSGSQAQTLASIQGQYNMLIQQNSSAASLYTSMLNNIGAVAANKDIPADRLTETVNGLKTLATTGLGIIDAINGGSLLQTNAPGFTSPVAPPRAGFPPVAVSPPTVHLGGGGRQK